MDDADARSSDDGAAGSDSAGVAGTRAGVVVAGGRSTRFGDADKATADLAGTPMVRRVADRLAPAVDSLVVNCRAEQVGPIRGALSGYALPVEFAEDETPDEGPLAGIRTGLAAADAPYAVVVSCDVPFVDPALVAHLFDRAANRDAAVPRLEDGWFQPTYAVYRVEAMVRATDAALASGERKPIAPLDALDWVEVNEGEVEEVSSVDTFDNLNTREEFAAAERRIRRADGETSE